MCGGIANYCEICRKNLYVWRTGKLELSLPCANSYDQSQLQHVATKEFLLQSILEEFHCICKVHVENVCMYWHALLIYTIHIIDAYSSTTKDNASSSIYIWLQWHSKHLCTLGVLIQHMAMAYATSMLPISQGALETSISTWRLLSCIVLVPC